MWNLEPGRRKLSKHIVEMGRPQIHCWGCWLCFRGSWCESKRRHIIKTQFAFHVLTIVPNYLQMLRHQYIVRNLTWLLVSCSSCCLWLFTDGCATKTLRNFGAVRYLAGDTSEKYAPFVNLIYIHLLPTSKILCGELWWISGGDGMLIPAISYLRA